MKKNSLLLALLLISSSVLFAKDAKTNGTTIGRVDRSSWQVIAASSEQPADGGGKEILIDGKHNNWWHTMYNPTAVPPHWVIIDLGEGGAREFTGFQLYKRWNMTRYQKNVQVYVSNEGDTLPEGNTFPGDFGWKLIGEALNPDNGGFKMLTINTPASADNKGRYLLFYFSDFYDPYICLSEIYGLGEIEDNLYGGTPYPDAPHAVPGVIEAEDFDRGGQDVGYSWYTDDIRKQPADAPEDHDYSNYRWDAEDGDVYIMDGPGDGNRHLAHFNQHGEYLNYTIDVAEDFYYDLSFLAAADGADRYFQLLLDGMPLLADYNIIPATKPINAENGFYPVINTGSWSVYKENVVERAFIKAGKHVLRVYGLFDFDKITISKSYLGLPYNEENTLPAKTADAPFVLQAEDFDLDNGYADMTYHVATPSTNTYRPTTTANIAEGPDGDYHLVTGNGDWYSYTVNAPTSKAYKYVFRFYGQRAAASNYLVMEVNGEIDDELTSRIDFPTSYDDPFEIYMPVTLKEGKNILRIKTNGGNLDKIEILKGLFDYEGGPFEAPFIVSGEQTTIIPARDFDKGGAEIAFHDLSNSAGNDISIAYRSSAEDGSAAVQMEYRNGKNPDGSNNITISNSNAGEWLAYSLDVEEDGLYDILFTLSTNNDARVNHIEIDDEAYPEISVRTVDWATFLDFAVGSNIKLTRGRHILYAYYYGNFDKIKILKHQDANPYENTPQAIPGLVEAWKFDDGSLSFSVASGSLGGANNAIRQDVAVPIRGNEGNYYVDVIEPNTPQFLNYTVDIKEDGHYKITFKLRSNNRVLNDDGTPVVPVAERFTLAPASNVWRPALDSDKSRSWYASFVANPEAQGEWQEVVFPVMKLHKGIDTLKLTVGGGNIYDIQYASLNFELITDIIDRSNWSVIPVQGVGYSGIDVNDVKQGAASGFNTDIEFALKCTIDDDFSSFWHQGSNAPTEMPHWMIYDLGVPTEITQLISYRRQSYPDNALIEWSGSNESPYDSDPNSWPLLGAASYPETAEKSGYLDLVVDVPQPAKIRYLKLNIPEAGPRGVYTNVLEVFARGKSFPIGPFNGPHTVPGIVQAEDFNTGGEGNAFHASDPGAGNTYRPDEAANIVAIDGGYSLVTATGDWYEYTVELPNPAIDYNYEFVIYGEKASANTLTLQVNGISTDFINFPSAYNTPTVAGPVKLKKGTNTILIKANGGSLDKFEIRPAEYQGTPFYGTAAVAPGKVEAEDFDLGGEGIAFHDVNPSITTDWTAYRPELEGGPYLEKLSTTYTIGGTQQNEWIAYTVEFPETALYDFTLNVATSNANTIIGISIDSDGATDTTTVKTTGWSDFQDFKIKGVSVTAGIHQVYIRFGLVNIDYFEIAKSTTAIKELPTPSGKVYTEGGVLKVKEFPTTTSLAVYNLLGQKIANYKAVNSGVEVNLPSKGIYIVKLQNQGITVTHKVIAK